MSYMRDLGRCVAWAVFVVMCMMINYAIADALELSKGSYGYVRGKKVISPYGFLVQLLLIVEVGGAWYVLRSRKAK